MTRRFFAPLLVLTFLFSPFIAPLEASAAVSNWQRSVSFYPFSPTDFESEDYRKSVDHFKSLGFNYVTLIIPYSQANAWSSDVFPGGNAPTDAALISGIQYAHSQGMGVVLKPHLDPRDGAWRAHIRASDRDAWFANYQNMLTKYATIARDHNVEVICIGTELIAMASSWENGDNTTRWQGMIGAVRSIYSGKLFYDANWGGGSFENEPPQIGFWGDLDYIGISAYYTFSGDGSVASLKSQWDQINNNTIRPLAEQYGKPILFAEVGYRSSTNAYQQPWDPWYPGSYSAQEQINDYIALVEYWNDYSYMQGIGLWYAVVDPNAGGSGNTDYLIQNKPVEATFKQLFGGGTTPPPPPPAPMSGSYRTDGSVNPSSVNAGQPVELTASITNTESAMGGANIDLEVYDSAGNRVHQQIFEGQSFADGESRDFTTSFTPSTDGTYTFKIGVFSTNWGTLYVWNDEAAKVQIGGGTPPPPPPPPSGDVSVWWPTGGANVSGVQPFKARIDDRDLSSYQMFWQVDGDRLNDMYDSDQDAPHKEAMVDLSGWSWRENGPYTITFVAKDSNGTTIGQKSVQITVTH